MYRVGKAWYDTNINIKLTSQPLEVAQHWQDQSSAETIGKAPGYLLLMVYTAVMEQSQEKWQLYIVRKTVFNLKGESEMQEHFQRIKHNYWVSKRFLCQIYILV